MGEEESWRCCWISRDLTPRRRFPLLFLSPPHRVHLRHLCVIVAARHISELATRSPILSPIIRDRQRRDHQLSLTITPPTRNTVDGNPQWCCTYLLDPKDPLFVDVGEAFIKQQIKEYGDITDIYNCDTFNENSPPTNDPTYISLLGAAVYKAMSKGDKDAVWLMQGWLFYSDAAFWKPPQMKALLHSVPIGKMIVLDLFAEVKPIWIQSSQFYGVPYVWCMLHNFGGNLEMYGVLDTISSGPNDARLSENSTMVGVGMCMEGIEHNPVVYELMSEMAFRSQNVDVKDWLKSYSYRRYGQAFPPIEAAWTILYQTIYNCTDGIAVFFAKYI